MIPLLDSSVERVPQKPRILVVEDEALVADDLEERLSQLGYQVCGVVDTAEQAIERAVALSPDLVLMDIHLLGEKDGIEAAAEIRLARDIAVVFVTAHADDATLKRAGLAEPFGYVLKPFDERELKATIEMALYRKQAEARLRKMERWLATTLSSIGDGVLATDRAGRITYINAMGEAITGWSREAALGRDFYEVFVVQKEPVRAPLTDLLERAALDGVTFSLEEGHSLRTRGGELRALDDTIAPIREDDGLLTGYVAVFRDASARKEAQQHRLQMEQKVREAQRFESLGLMAGGIAHDFNNLLSIITLRTSMSRTQVAEGSEVGESLREIETAANRAAQLCNQMLVYAGKRALTMEVLDLSEVVRNAEPLLRAALQNRAALVLELENGLPSILGDSGQIQQAILNLVLNGAEALASPGGRLTVGTRKFWASQSFLSQCRFGADLPEGKYASLKISDSGYGMGQETLAHIFDPFFTTKFAGRGLGLPAVLGIVRAHGGTIGVQSAPGKGTTFQILFPLTQLAARSDPTPAGSVPSKSRWQGGGRALLVDDDAAIRTVGSLILSQCGFEAETAENGQQGVQKLLARGGDYRVVLLDLTMPGLHGDQVLKVIRSHFLRLPVVLISGYTEEDTERLYAADDRTIFLHKPYSLDQLHAKLTTLLGNQ